MSKNLTIEFEVWHPDLKKAVKVTREGRLFDVAGRDVLLFPIGVMCEAIGRDPKTLRRWERERIWPKPMWKPPDGRCTRWYSSHQVMLAFNAHKKHSKGHWGFSHSPHFDLSAFLSEVAATFYTVDATEATKGDTR